MQLGSLHQNSTERKKEKKDLEDSISKPTNELKDLLPLQTKFMVDRTRDPQKCEKIFYFHRQNRKFRNPAFLSPVARSPD